MKQILSLVCTLALCAIVAVGCSDDDKKVEKTFTVTFDSQGGSKVDSQTVTEGEKVTEPAEPTKDGVIFAGWYTDTSYSHLWDFDKNTVTENITLYARWTARTFTVTFNTNGGDPVDDLEVADGGLLANLPIPTKANSAFDGWYTDQNLTTKFDSKTPITGNITLYAKWTTVTRETLEKLVQEAYYINSNNYTTASYDKVMKKTEEAQNILNKQGASSKEIIDAYQALSKAISELEALPVRPAVVLGIDPQPVDGVIYVNPKAYSDGEFHIYAYGKDADGEEATNGKVIFTHTGLDKWAMERSGTESGMDKIFISDNFLSFIINPDVTTDATITIKSADNTSLSQTITLKVFSSEDAKNQYLNIINSLPALSEITLDNFEEIEKKINEAETFYNSISPTDKETAEITKAQDKLEKYWYTLDDFWKINYSFTGNTCIVEGESFEYVANGTFPAGTLTSKWEENGIDDNGKLEYFQSRMTLKEDHTYQTHERTSNSPEGKNPTEWMIVSEGEYKNKGTQNNGGTLYMHETKYYEDMPESRSVIAPHSSKAKSKSIRKQR